MERSPTGHFTGEHSSEANCDGKFYEVGSILAVLAAGEEEVIVCMGLPLESSSDSSR